VEDDDEKTGMTRSTKGSWCCNQLVGKQEREQIEVMLSTVIGRERGRVGQIKSRMRARYPMKK
jgi:hypothetical protein